MLHLVDEGSDVYEGDGVVVLTHARNLPALRSRFEPNTASEDDGD